MSAHSRTCKRSINTQVKQAYIHRMLFNQLFRSRRISLIIGLIILLIATMHFYSDPLATTKDNVNFPSPDSKVPEKQLHSKIVEIKDRHPFYKLYIYDGYEVALDRHRAQVKLLDNLKLHDKCQENPTTTVLDVGASLGQFGLYAAACGCQVYMFEVDPIKIALLRKSIKLNSFESRVILITKAVSDLPSKSRIYMSLNTSSQVSSDKARESSTIYSVDTINLNQFNFSKHIYLFRVDVEGYEIHVFRSSEKLFLNNLVHHVLFQFTPSGTDKVLQNDVLAYMRDILGAKRFYALHPKKPVLYGPMYNDDIDQFYIKHQSKNLERDVYALFKNEDFNIDSKPYEFQLSFD